MGGVHGSLRGDLEGKSGNKERNIETLQSSKNALEDEISNSITNDPRKREMFRMLQDHMHLDTEMPDMREKFLASLRNMDGTGAPPGTSSATIESTASGRASATPARESPGTPPTGDVNRLPNHLRPPSHPPPAPSPARSDTNSPHVNSSPRSMAPKKKFLEGFRTYSSSSSTASDVEDSRSRSNSMSVTKYEGDDTLSRKRSASFAVPKSGESSHFGEPSAKINPANVERPASCPNKQDEGKSKMNIRACIENILDSEVIRKQLQDGSQQEGSNSRSHTPVAKNERATPLDPNDFQQQIRNLLNRDIEGGGDPRGVMPKPHPSTTVLHPDHAPKSSPARSITTGVVMKDKPAPQSMDTKIATTGLPIFPVLPIPLEHLKKQASQHKAKDAESDRGRAGYPGSYPGGYPDRSEREKYEHYKQQHKQPMYPEQQQHNHQQQQQRMRQSAAENLKYSQSEPERSRQYPSSTAAESRGRDQHPPVPHGTFLTQAMGLRPPGEIPNPMLVPPGMIPSGSHHQSAARSSTKASSYPPREAPQPQYTRHQEASQPHQYSRHTDAAYRDTRYHKPTVDEMARSAAGLPPQGLPPQGLPPQGLPPQEIHKSRYSPGPRTHPQQTMVDHRPDMPHHVDPQRSSSNRPYDAQQSQYPDARTHHMMHQSATDSSKYSQSGDHKMEPSRGHPGMPPQMDPRAEVPRSAGYPGPNRPPHDRYPQPRHMPDNRPQSSEDRRSSSYDQRMSSQHKRQPPPLLALEPERLTPPHHTQGLHPRGNQPTQASSMYYPKHPPPDGVPRHQFIQQAQNKLVHMHAPSEKAQPRPHVPPSNAAEQPLDLTVKRAPSRSPPRNTPSSEHHTSHEQDIRHKMPSTSPSVHGYQHDPRNTRSDVNPHFMHPSMPQYRPEMLAHFQQQNSNLYEQYMKSQSQSQHSRSSETRVSTSAPQNPTSTAQAIHSSIMRTSQSLPYATPGPKGSIMSGETRHTNPLATPTAHAAPPTHVTPPIPPPTSQSQTPRQTPPQSGAKLNANLLGNHPADDILFLKCNLCGATYGSKHSFQKHFMKAHGGDPGVHHVTIQSISETKLARANQGGSANNAPNELLRHLQGRDFEKCAPTDSARDVYRQSERYLQDEKDKYSKNSDGAPTPNKMTGGDSPKAVERRDSSDSNMSDSREKYTMKCMQCGLEFSTHDWGTFKQHMYKHENSNESVPRCEICRISFRDSSEWRAHMSISHMSHSCVCRTCFVGFPNAEELSRHLRMVHPDMKNVEIEFRCLYCPRNFASENELYVHTKIHESEIESRTTVHPMYGMRSKDERNANANTPIRKATPDSTSEDRGQSASPVTKPVTAADKPVDKPVIADSNQLFSFLDLIQRKVEEEHHRQTRGVQDETTSKIPTMKDLTMITSQAMDPQKHVKRPTDGGSGIPEKRVKEDPGRVSPYYRQKDDTRPSTSPYYTPKDRAYPPGMSREDTPRAYPPDPRHPAMSREDPSHSPMDYTRANADSRHTAKDDDFKTGVFKPKNEQPPHKPIKQEPGVKPEQRDGSDVASLLKGMLYTLPLIQKPPGNVREIIETLVTAEVMGNPPYSEQEKPKDSKFESGASQSVPPASTVSSYNFSYQDGAQNSTVNKDSNFDMNVRSERLSSDDKVHPGGSQHQTPDKISKPPTPRSLDLSMESPRSRSNSVTYNPAKRFLMKQQREEKAAEHSERISSSESRITSTESRIMSPESRIMSPESRIMSPESKRIMSPESKLRLSSDTNSPRVSTDTKSDIEAENKVDDSDQNVGDNAGISSQKDGNCESSETNQDTSTAGANAAPKGPSFLREMENIMDKFILGEDKVGHMESSPDLPKRDNNAPEYSREISSKDSSPKSGDLEIDAPQPTSPQLDRRSTIDEKDSTENAQSLNSSEKINDPSDINKSESEEINAPSGEHNAKSSPAQKENTEKDTIPEVKVTSPEKTDTNCDSNPTENTNLQKMDSPSPKDLTQQTSSPRAKPQGGARHALPAMVATPSGARHQLPMTISAPSRSAAVAKRSGGSRPQSPAVWGAESARRPNSPAVPSRAKKSEQK